MNSIGVTLHVLPGYRLKLSFLNGSEAIVDMSRRVRAIRFRRLVSPDLFSTAQVEGDEVVWRSGDCMVRASINELLDSMQMS